MLVLDRRHSVVELHLDAALIRMRAKRLPHLARPETWVLKLLDQRRRSGTGQVQRREQRASKREVLDPLHRPLGVDLRAGDPPHLLRVGTEERVVEASTEVRRHPVLEAVHSLPVPVQLASEVGERAESRLEQAETRDDVARLERVGVVVALVVDAGKARPDEELVAEHRLPQAVDLGELREEPMTAEVEAVSVVFDRLGDATDDPIRLVDRSADTA